MAETISELTIAVQNGFNFVFTFCRFAPDPVQAWETFKESLGNLTYSMELWRDPIKKIEGNFGSGVKSYFILLKWLLLLNIPIFIISFGFITIPQLVYKPSVSQVNPQPFTGAELLTGEVGKGGGGGGGGGGATRGTISVSSKGGVECLTVG